MKIVITGITGFLGKELLHSLRDDGHEYYCFVRGQSVEKAKKQVEQFENIKIIDQNITDEVKLEDSGLSYGDVDKVLHMAALYDIETNYDDSYLANVVGTENIIEFIKKCPNLKEFHYVSTIAVAGNFKGEYEENQFDCGQKTSNHYARTKYLAEKKIREESFHDSIKTIIYRPGIIIGHSETGEIATLNGPYYFFRTLKNLSEKIPFIKKIKFLAFPFSKNTIMPIIPVDHVASMIYTSLCNLNHQEKLKTYHLISKNAPTLNSFIIDTVRSFEYEGRVFSLPSSVFNSLILKSIGVPKEMSEYVYSKVHYNSHNAELDLALANLSNYQDYKNKFFENIAR